MLNDVMVEAQTNAVLDLGFLRPALATGTFVSLYDLRKCLARRPKVLKVLGLELTDFTIIIGQRGPSCR